jgi:predicted nucleic acid-binding protein
VIFVDTTFFLAILDHRDSLHPRAIAWAAHLATEQKLTTEYVLLEVVNSLSRTPDRPRAIRFLQSLPQLPDLSVVWSGEVEFNHARQLFERRLDQEWSLTDCGSMEVMRRFAITKALTHDHHFEQAGYEALLRRDPP